MFLLLASTTSDGIFFVETCPKHSGWSHYEEIQVHLNWHSSPERFPESDVQAHNLLAMYVELNRKMHSQQQWSFYLSSRKNRTAKIVAQTSLICPDSPTKHCRCVRFGKWKVEECCLLSLIEMGRCFALIHCWIKSKILFSSVHSTRRWLVFSLCRAFPKFCSDSAPLSWFMGFQMQSYAAAKTPSLRSAFFVKKVNNIIGITETFPDCYETLQTWWSIVTENFFRFETFSRFRKDIFPFIILVELCGRSNWSQLWF